MPLSTAQTTQQHTAPAGGNARGVTIFASNVNDPKRRNFDLYVINVDDKGLESVTCEETFDGFPMFTPAARKLVFASNRNAAAVRGDTNIFIADWVE